MPTGCCRSGACAPGGVVAAPGGNHGLVVAWTGATMTLPVSMSFHPIATAPVSLSVAAFGVDRAARRCRRSGTSGVCVARPTW